MVTCVFIVLEQYLMSAENAIIRLYINTRLNKKKIICLLFYIFMFI